MSKTDHKPNDIFTECMNNVEKFFDVVGKTTPVYHQTATDVQQRYLQAWKNVIRESITIEKEFAVKSGIILDANEDSGKAIKDMTEYAITSYQTQNKLALNTAETSQKIFDMFNENTKVFAALNKDMIEFMSSVMKPRTKD